MGVLPKWSVKLEDGKKIMLRPVTLYECLCILRHLCVVLGFTVDPALNENSCIIKVFVTILKKNSCY